MRAIRQVNIINRQNYFFNDMTNIEDFDPNLLNMDQVSFESNESIIYDIKYIKNLGSSNSLYLVFNNLDAHIEESGENKYLIFCFKRKKLKSIRKLYRTLERN